MDNPPHGELTQRIRITHPQSYDHTKPRARQNLFPGYGCSKEGTDGQLDEYQNSGLSRQDRALLFLADPVSRAMEDTKKRLVQFGDDIRTKSDLSYLIKTESQATQPTLNAINRLVNWATQARSGISQEITALNGMESSFQQCLAMLDNGKLQDKLQAAFDSGPIEISLSTLNPNAKLRVAGEIMQNLIKAFGFTINTGQGDFELRYVDGVEPVMIAGHLEPEAYQLTLQTPYGHDIIITQPNPQSNRRNYEDGFTVQVKQHGIRYYHANGNPIRNSEDFRRHLGDLGIDQELVPRNSTGDYIRRDGYGQTDISYLPLVYGIAHSIGLSIAKLADGTWLRPKDQRIDANDVLSEMAVRSSRERQQV
ncbi:hypothetical protein KC726_03890 [Candidatus Woesebacteria bacterium]|nr:hypothetical protein [Candidatus Woesebacteria bacterium]